MQSSELRITTRRFDLPFDLGTAPQLGLCEVQVWHGSIELPGAGEIQAAHAILADEERERAKRFHFEKHRNRYIVCRGILRRLIAAQLGIEASALRFQYSEFGKPYLDSGTRGARSQFADLDFVDLNFNVSHSEGYGTVALSWKRRVGVDVERIRNDFTLLDVADRFFSSAEKQALREIPKESLPEAFFRCWTRKEAYIKALGEGLSHPLEHFDVSMESDPENALLSTRPDPEVRGRWLVKPFAAETGFSGAVAVECSPPW